MAVRQSRGRYVVEFQQGGARIFRRLPPGITQAQARELETKIRRELFDGQQLGRRDELTLAGAIGLWLGNNRRKNQKQAVSEARQWEPFVSGRLLRDAPEVAQEAVRKWQQGLPQTARTGTKKPKNYACTGYNLNSTENSTGTQWRNISRNASTATVNRRLALLKAVCKHAWKQGLVQENLSGRISLLREDNKREVYLTREEVRTLARSTKSQQLAAAILVAAYTGLRASELLALTPTDLHKDGLTVRRSKTGKPRVVPVPGPARPYLRALPLDMSYWQLHREFSEARTKAGMPHVRFHDLRHVCASWLINAQVDLYTVGKILGHSGPQTTARYAHLATATLEKAMRKLR